MIFDGWLCLTFEVTQLYITQDDGWKATLLAHTILCQKTGDVLITTIIIYYTNISIVTFMIPTHLNTRISKQVKSPRSATFTSRSHSQTPSLFTISYCHVTISWFSYTSMVVITYRAACHRMFLIPLDNQIPFVQNAYYFSSTWHRGITQKSLLWSLSRRQYRVLDIERRWGMQPW